MRRLRILRLALATAAIALSGCALYDHDLGVPLSLESVEKFPPGSHYSAVLDEFGPPTKLSVLENGMAFLYEHVTLTERQYGLILFGEIGKWIKAVYATADADVEAMLFIFDENGTLRGADAQSWSADAGAGMSMTLIFSAGSFTDTEQYESSATQSLDWGRALTMSPLVTLNSRQNLESGANGVQLTTNSEGAGQHTLELGSH
ncbi:MAG: hypothetical protein ACR2QL_04575 [Woeseiaceae bacterium]